MCHYYCDVCGGCTVAEGYFTGHQPGRPCSCGYEFPNTLYWICGICADIKENLDCGKQSALVEKEKLW